MINLSIQYMGCGILAVFNVKDLNIQGWGSGIRSMYIDLSINLSI